MEALSAPPLVEAEAPRAAEERLDVRWGALLDASVPAGVGGALVFQPFSWLRVHGGGASGAGAGAVRGGATVVLPLRWVRPSLGVEVGHAFQGDSAWAMSWVGSEAAPFASRVTYRYADLRLGVQAGFANVAFTAHLGLARVDAALPDVARTLSAATGAAFTGEPVRVRLLHPSLGLGLLFLG